ncbi:MAG: ABC transporter permease [Candidatus Hodarchaeales archaeon]|jgi:simple sugar transport system permease protein
MAFSDFLWFITLFGPLIGVIAVTYFCVYWEKLNKTPPIVSYLLLLTILALGIIIVAFSLIGILSVFGIMEISAEEKLSIKNARPILEDWYLFLLILSPIIAVLLFLLSTATEESEQQGLIQFYSTIIAISLAFLVSSLLILFAKADANPDLVDQWISNPLSMLDPIVEAGEILLNTSFGFDKFELLLDGKHSNDDQFYREFGRTLGLATPLIFAGLVFAISAKAGLFNIGGEGAFILGGFVGAVIGVWLPEMLPFSLSNETMNIIHLPLIFFCAALVGALFGFIPGVLRAYLGAHEVITTIMLNPIAYLLVFMMVRDHYTVPDLRTETPPVLESAKLDHLLPGPLGAEFLVALVVVVACYFLLFRTTLGLEFRAVGQNPSAAEYAGIPVKTRQIQAMALSGAIGGIGGAGLAVGYFWYFHPSHSGGLGFDGIAVAVLAANNPLALIPVAILFGALKNGGENLSTSMGIPRDIIEAMRGIIILFAAAPLVFAFLFKKRREMREEDDTKPSEAGIISEDREKENYRKQEESSV